MSARKSERLVNLLIALLSTRRFLTRQELRGLIEDYRNSTSESAFERQFERDKEELRGLGVVIETGSNDPFFEEEDGYRINRSEFELPEIVFTAQELSALGLAGQVWQDTLAAEHTAKAFEALLAGGSAPDPELVPVLRPRLAGRDPDFDLIYDAVVHRVEVTFGYGGRSRRLQPWMLLQRRGRWYVYGFDLDHQQDRFYKLARFTTPARATGRWGGYEVPDDAPEGASRLEPSEDCVATVALREGAQERFPGAERIETDQQLPADFVAWRVSAHSDESLISEVVAASPHALVLAPTELRQRVISRLREALA